MRYILLIYTREVEMAEASEVDMESLKKGHWAVMDATAKLGIFQGAEPLQPTSTATTVRIQNGKPLITDGPFAETREQLGGYYILDCKNLDEAIEWATKIPTACQGAAGCVEIRPIAHLPSRSG
jgi:hypothetical protein